jgi:hypothetical protein
MDPLRDPRTSSILSTRTMLIAVETKVFLAEAATAALAQRRCLQSNGDGRPSGHPSALAERPMP